MEVRYDDIGDRLKAFRLGSGLSAEEIARRVGISRTALYRFEKGELVKIETLEKLADLLSVSVTTLLGVGIEYYPSALNFFQRIRQIEEETEHLTVLAGPISFLLASESFMDTLDQSLCESIPEEREARPRMLAEVSQIMEILRLRRETYRRRRPSIVKLVSGLDVARFMRDGMVGSYTLPEAMRQERRALARAEVMHFADVISAGDMGIQIGIIPETLPHFGFQILRQPDREVLAVTPFRLGEHPNVTLGVAMITSAPEALALHRRMVADMWRRSLKGAAAVEFLNHLLETA